LWWQLLLGIHKNLTVRSLHVDTLPARNLLQLLQRLQKCLPPLLIQDITILNETPRVIPLVVSGQDVQCEDFEDFYAGGEIFGGVGAVQTVRLVLVAIGLGLGLEGVIEVCGEIIVD
jgi:hypothetical protein